MFAFTYYQPVSGIPEKSERELIEIWARSWSKHGWTPILLDRSHAMRNKFYEAILAIVKQRPSLNYIGYTEATYLKWLATQVGFEDRRAVDRMPIPSCIWTDYDVINTGWTPADCLDSYNRRTVIHPGKNSSTVFIEEPADLEWICQMLLWNTKPAVWNGVEDINDSTCFDQHWGEEGLDGVTADLYGAPSWDAKTTKLWHFANGVIPAPYRGNRAEFVRQKLDFWKANV